MDRKKYIYLRTQQEGSHLQAKERGLRGHQICKHLDLRHPASRTVRKETSTVLSPSLW